MIGSLNLLRFEPRVYLMSIILILIISSNCISSNLFKVNLLSKLPDKVSYLVHIVGLLALVYLFFNRTSYLPFLGPTVVPPSYFTTEKQPALKNNSIEHTIFIDPVETSKIESVIYWASDSNSNMGPELGHAIGPDQAYNNYSNSGIAKINPDNSATFYLNQPVSYQVGLFNKQLPLHIHYRYVYRNGFLSEVKTDNV